MKYKIYAYGFNRKDNLVIECADIEDMAKHSKALINDGRFIEVTAKIEEFS